MSKQGSRPDGRMRRPNRVDALEEKSTVAGIICQTCDNVTEEGSPYCAYCASYWKDVQAGLFDQWDN